MDAALFIALYPICLEFCALVKQHTRAHEIVQQQGKNMLVKQPAIYIMANRRNGAIYTGVTSDLIKRVYEHKYADAPGFTQKYGCKCLVYYELIDDMMSAIAREKQLKSGSRKKKLALIEKANPYWEDLYEKLI
jgi:predicted GIY-YIG superfamily endonuclease